MENKNLIKRIKREKPNKKWTEDEIIKIINYLREAPEIEAPTAKIFYKKLIERCSINATWDLIRFKVRHLKSSFKKANDWRKSTGAGLIESDSGTGTVEGKVLQMCPYYNQLNEIFGEKNVNGDFVVVDSGDMVAMNESLTESIQKSNLPADYNYSVINDVEGNELSSPPANSVPVHENSLPMQSGQSVSSSVSTKAQKFADKLKKHAPKSSAAHLAAFQAERNELFKMRLEWKKEKHEKELELSDRKLKLEEEKMKSEANLKILQLEKDEKLWK